MIGKPPWFDLPPGQWPPEARIAYQIMASAAERRLAAEAEKAGKTKEGAGAA